MKSYEEHLNAVKRTPFSITNVPEEFMNTEMILTAINGPYGCCDSLLSHIDAKYYTPEVCVASAKKNGWSLSAMKAVHQTNEVIETALKQTEWAIVFVKDTDTRRKYIQSYGKFSKEVQRDLENNKLL